MRDVKPGSIRCSPKAVLMTRNRHAAVITALIVIGAVAAPAERSAGAAPAPEKVISVSSVAALQSAVKQAQPGDRIELADGSYSTSSAIALTRSGTASAPITITAQHTGKAEIKGTDGFSFGSI